jgi:hypothetical protein
MGAIGRRATILAVFAASCAPTAEQQAVGFTPTSTTTSLRARQSRRFDTVDSMLLIRSAVGVLQDLGYSIEESQSQYGIVVGTKLAGGRIRAQIVVSASADRSATTVRATFQRALLRPGAMLAIGETIDDAEIYRGFFDKLAQSAFLTGHDI